ncbi:unnamed protein product, partial [Callosobruchus maculatus]
MKDILRSLWTSSSCAKGLLETSTTLYHTGNEKLNECEVQATKKTDVLKM